MRVWSVLLLAGWLLTGPVLAAGGSSGGTARPARVSPKKQAMEAYEKGLKHRDNAWKYEEKAQKAEKDKDRDKNLQKAAKEYAKAIAQQQQAVALDAENHRAYSSLGYALRKTGQYYEALQAYDQALKIEPDYVEAIEYRAEAYLGLGRLKDVRREYGVLVSKNPRYAAQLLEAMQTWAAEQDEEAPARVDSMKAWIARQAENPPAPAPEKAW